MSKKTLLDLAFYSLLFLIFFFLGAIIFSQVILKGETVSVPDLTGKTLAEARTELAKKDLSVSQKDSEFNDRWEKGLVIRQDPAPGSRIQVTKIVQVVISNGSRKVTVPPLEGKSLEIARDLLGEAGLVKGASSQIHTARYPAGRIIAQNPKPDRIVERNSPVGLLLSQGDQEDRFLMPDLIGRRADRVIVRLKDLDFRVADIHYVYYPGLSSGIIVKQSPPNGYGIQKGNQITLEVSR